MTRPRHGRETIAVFLLAAVALFLLMPRELDLFDEGIILAGAMRVMVGEVPHRDFMTLYGPAPNYIIAALWHLTDQQMLAARLYGVAIEGGIVAAIFAITARQAGRGLALFAALLGMRTMLADSMFLYPALPAVLLALIGLALITRRGGAEQPASLVPAGLCAGAATLFRYDSGVIILGALGLAVVLPQLFVRGPASAIRSGLWLMLGFAVVLVPLVATYAALGVGPSFRSDIIDYAVNWYARMRGLPLPLRHELLHNPGGFIGYYLPIALALLAVPACVEQLRALRREGRRWDGASPALSALAILTAVLVYKGLVRASMLHMVMATVASLPLAALLAHRLWRAGWRWRGRRAGPAAAAAMLLLVAVPTVPTAARHAGRVLTEPGATEAGALLGRANGVASRCPIRPELGPGAAADDQWLAARYVSLHTRPSERIFVGSARHDRLHKNSATIYFLAGRLPGSRWQQLDPGEITRADVQTRVIQELKQGGVRWIVKDATYEGFNEPNDSARSSGVHLLDAFIDRAYRPVATFGAVRVWLRRDVPAPAADDGCR